MDKTLEALARDEVNVSKAREAVWQALDAHTGARDAYVSLCRWTWRAMVERRLDDDLRSWHRLLLDAAAKLASRGDEAGNSTRARNRLGPAEAAERLRALADLLRLSVDAALASPPAELAGRAHVLEILQCLAATPGEHVDREKIRKSVGLGEANLSRVLTLMSANGLVERLPRGKVASFRATQRGLALAAPGSREHGQSRTEMPSLRRPTRWETEHPKGHRYLPELVILNNDRRLRRKPLGPMGHEPTYKSPLNDLPPAASADHGRTVSHADQREYVS